MRPINARGDLDHESPVPFCPKAMHFQTEHGRGDGGDGGAAQGTLVGLVELADIDSPGRRLLGLAYAEDDHATAAVRHRGDILGKVRLRKPFRRRQLRLPLQIARLDDTSGHRGIKEFIG